jgi:hypothetical protein
MDDTEYGREAEPRRSRIPFSWLSLLFAGWVLYEVTAQPALGTALVCLKFGWDDFRTARWLRRNDPDCRRGRACFWAFVAWGMAKVAFVAFGIVAVISVVYHRVIKQRGQLPAVVVWSALGTLATIGVMFALGALAGAYSLCLARRHRLRLWVHRGVHAARRIDTWPPDAPDKARNDFEGVMMFLGMAVIIFPFLVYLLASSIEGQPNWGKQPMPTSWLVLWLLWVIATMFVFLRSVKAATATSPAECWPPEAVDPAPADPVGW